MKIIETEWCSPEYQSALELRHEVLREPLGLKLTPEELDGEHAQIHLGAYDGEELIATITARPGADGVAQIRQMAVRPERQQTGVGTELIAACESKLREQGFTEISLDSRVTSVAFYEKLGYSPVGDPFKLVTLMHQKMKKTLTPS